MALKLDSRQTRQRSKLDQLSTTTDLRLDAIMNLINDELTMPLRMRANLGAGVDGTPNQNLYIDSISVKTLDSGAADSGHERSRTIPPISGTLPTYAGGGYITFPTSSGGSITGSSLTLDKAYTLTLTSGQFVKILVWLQADGKFGMEIGVPAASEAAAALPAAPTDAFALGYVVMSNTAGVISKVLNENLYQFVGGGGSGGTGTGAGEINVVTNSSAVTDITTGWTAVPSSGFASRQSTGSPLDPVIPTGFQLTASATSQTFTSASLTVPTSLRNRKLKLEFAMTMATAAFKVDVLNSSGVRFALTTDASGATNLPALSSSGKFVTYFDMDAGSTIQVRFTSILTSGTLSFTNVIVGPGIQPQGAVVGEWTSYTPTGSWTTNTTYTGRYRRVGDSAEILIDVSLAGAPTAARLTMSQSQFLNGLNLTVNSSALPNTTDVALATGTWTGLDSGILETYGGVISMDGGSNKTITLGYSTGANTSSAVTNTTPISWSTGDNVSLRMVVPIAEWAGSGTVQLAQNDVEFAYNTSTSTTTSDTTSFGYGPGGALIGSIANALERTVQFQTNIQTGDQLVLEVFDGTTWLDVNKALPFNTSLTYVVQNTTSYGMGVKSSASNKVVVRFGAYATPSGATYASAGAAWSGYASFYWRVRKASAGAAVGFGLVVPGTSAGLVSASGLPGNTTGNAIASGYVGQVLSVVQSAWASAGTSGQVFNVGSAITIPDGIWMASYMLQWRANGATVTNADTIGGFSATTGNSFVGLGACNSTENYVVTTTMTNALQAASASGIICQVSGGTLTLLDGSTLAASTIYFKAYTGSYTAGTPQVRGYLSFVRIA